MPEILDVLDLLRSGTPDDVDRLRQHGVVRGATPKEVAGDYAEYLVKEHFGGQLARRGNPGYDVLAEGYGRISVKSRSLAVEYYRHMTVRQREERDFDHLVLVEFAPDWRVAFARRLTWEEVPAVRDYLYKPPKGGVYSRFYRNGKWRTACATVPLQDVQEHLRWLRVAT